MSAGSSGVWKTILLPPILALLLYLLTSYLVLPLYTRYRARASYTALPTSLTNSIPAPRTLFSRLQSLMGRPRSNSVTSGESLLGDEELEEGLADGNAADRAREELAEVGRRLSRELERGFMDESDDENDDGRQGRR